MTSIVVVLVVLVGSWLGISMVQRRRRGLVAERGMSIGADLRAMADQPRVRVRAVTKEGPDHVHLVLAPERPDDDRSGLVPATDLDLIVALREGDFGFELLHEWHRSGSSLAIVVPPGSRIVRLRSIDDLQPLTLRRADPG